MTRRTLLFGLWASVGTEKLHGKITYADGTRTEITFTVQPRETLLELDGNAVAALGDYVDFILGPKNTVEINGKTLPLSGIKWVP